MFTDVDIGFILEAPAGEFIGPAAAGELAQAARLREGLAVDCGGLENENESVALVRRDGVSIHKFEKMIGTWDASIRSPVLAVVQKGLISCRMGVWHAPPAGKDDLRSAAWPKILSKMKDEKVDFILGDFNAPLAVRRSEYTCASEGKIGGTTLSNPNLVRAASLADLVTDQAYDRVYQYDKTKLRVDQVGRYISPLPNLVLPRRNASEIEKKDPRRVYAISDHLPVMLQVHYK